MLKSRLCFKERWNILRVNNQKNKNVCIQILLNKKKYLPVKTLFGLQGRGYHATLLSGESFFYHFLGSVQTLRTTTSRIIKLETKSLQHELVHSLILSYPVNKKELFLKLTAPKKYAKSLKNFCEELHFYCITCCTTEILSKSNSFTSISQGYSKTCIPALCMWNIKKPNNRSLDIFVIIYILFIFLYVFKL